VAGRNLTEDIVHAVEQLPSDEADSLQPRERPTPDSPMLPPPERARDRVVRLGEDSDSLDWGDVRARVGGEFPPPWDVPADEGAIEKVVEEWPRPREGAHACAWYISFHWRQPLWGIHILEPCWSAVAERFWRHQPPNVYRRPIDAVRAAFFYLFNHELYHYCSDVGASLIEITKGRADVYIPHHHKIYLKTYGTSDCLDEALANRYVYGRDKTMRVSKSYLKAILLAQPGGYRDFLPFVGNDFWIGRRTQMNQFLSLQLHPRPELPIENMIELVGQDAYSEGHRVPIYLRIPPGHVQRIFPRF
jgi:hypothetical protein